MTSTQKRNMRRWYDFLRSGKFRQTTGQLARGRGRARAYCCLGVACKAVKAPFTDDHGIPPMQVLEAFGIWNWLLNAKGSKESAFVMNDVLQYSFRRIAAAVRRTYPEAWR